MKAKTFLISLVPFFIALLISGIYMNMASMELSFCIFIYFLLYLPCLDSGMIKLPGCTVFCIYSFLRYVVLSFMLIIRNKSDVIDGLEFALLLFLIEEIASGIALMYFRNRYFHDIETQVKNRELNNEQLMAKNDIVFIALTAIVIGIIITHPNTIAKLNFIWSIRSNINVIKYGEASSGILSILVDIGRLTVPVIISKPLIKKYRETHNSVYYYISAATIMLFTVMIFSGISRNSAILPGIACIYALIVFFPNKTKRTVIVSGIALAVVLVALTIFKNQYTGRSITTFDSIINYLDSYLSGPKSIMNAISTYKNFRSNFNFKIMMSDCFYNVPGLSGYFNSEMRTSTFYNVQVYRGGLQRDAIIPTFGQGLFYFGYLGFWILQPIILRIVVSIDRKYVISKEPVMIFVTAYCATRLGTYVMHNLSLAMSTIFGTLIPILIIIWLDNLISIKKSTFRG